MENTNQQPQSCLDRPVFRAFPGFTIEKLLITLIIVLAILSRLIMVGDRVMSHDEVNHVVPAYNYYMGRGYSHDPVTHGPFQFHMLALSYFLLGDNDFSSRVPAALFSIAAIVFVLFAFRRYLGRVGTLVCGALFLISPFILFYGRYTRNEAFIELFAVLTFYAFLRYYERRDNFSLYLLAVVTALQFATKEVAYIYCAQLLLFCGFIFLRDLWKMHWESRKQQSKAGILFLVTVLLLILALGFKALDPAILPDKLPIGTVICGAAGILCMLCTIIYIVRALGWSEIRTSASFNLIVFLGALILPQLTAFPVKLIGWDPLDYAMPGILKTGIVLGIFIILSFAIGIWWNRGVFLKSAAAFYLIFIFFYTSVFSNGQGFFTGIIGGLGYWLSQQGVQRGGQPLYYYALVQLPVYEFAAITGTIIALIIAIRKRAFWGIPGDRLTESCADPEIFEDLIDTDEDGDPDPESSFSVSEAEEAVLPDTRKIPTLLFFLYWGISALAAYSVAGEKMPWLSVHIAIPLAMSAAWGIGWLLESITWEKIFSAKGLIGLAALTVCIVSGCSLIGCLGGTVRPFSGKDTEHLRATASFVTALTAFCISLAALLRSWKGLGKAMLGRTVLTVIMALLCILQARTAFTASFINYDYANELLVYAHAAPGPKVVLHEIEDIAARMGEGKAIHVAYDNDALYPYWWYFRDYTNKNYFGDGNPTRDLRNYDVIILNSSKDGRMEPIVKNEYYRYQYKRLWWPNQDYFNLSFSKVWSDLANSAMREALFQIWLNRDYTKYAAVTGNRSLTPETWSPAADISVYIRKDILRKMFKLSDTQFLTDSETAEEDEDEKFTQLEPVFSLGAPGNGEGQFTGPRGAALSPDEKRIYVLDSDNNRVQYFDRSGSFLGMWDGSETGRTFNQPWGIATDTEGNVYIADTWNHRMTKFTADGKFLLQWNAQDPQDPAKSFYGPRSIAIGSDGRVFVSDTGNKCIRIYDTDGQPLGKFGTSGMGPGEMDEPVGIALLDDTRLAVADTWNQRVQIFDVSGNTGVPLNAFDVSAWYTQSLNNKPYLAGKADGTIWITDPEGYLVMEYSAEGALIRSWNGGGGNIDRYSMPTGILLASDGTLWVTDAENSRVNQFDLTAGQ